MPIPRSVEVADEPGSRVAGRTASGTWPRRPAYEVSGVAMYQLWPSGS